LSPCKERHFWPKYFLKNHSNGPRSCGGKKRQKISIKKSELCNELPRGSIFPCMRSFVALPCFVDINIADWQGVDCRNVDFQNVDFQNVDFQNVDLKNVDYQNVDFQFTDCQNVNFQFGNFQINIFQNVDFQINNF
jgi:uncharacterized protein YjbI with pentapeptide repeats